MSVLNEVQRRLQTIPTLQVTRNYLLAQATRFGIGGPAGLFITSRNRTAFLESLRVVLESGIPWTLIGGGTNLVIADAGVPGAVLRFDGGDITRNGNRIRVEAGAVLQTLVDLTVLHGLQGLETMTGIPGSVGGALYGNAGAYGHSMQEIVATVDFFDGAAVRTIDNAVCGFHYRDSRFKTRKDWVILSAELALTLGDADALQRRSAEILDIRNRKFPPTMRCAGSFFKNCLFAHLPVGAQREVPPDMVRDGKVPAAWFLEQVGAKGRRHGGVQIADYHANTPYNTGSATARDVVELITDLKRLVRSRFGFDLEEEVQYVGFDDSAAPAARRPNAPGATAQKH